MLREEAAITDSRDSGSITYRGNIREGAKNCWISFPGKYASAWKALTEENQGDSVACVFLCTKEDGLCLGRWGLHAHPFPAPISRMWWTCEPMYLFLTGETRNTV